MHGAFLVSAELKNGKVLPVTIFSGEEKTCTVVNPWPGNKVQLVRNGKKVKSLMATGSLSLHRKMKAFN